MGSQSTAIFCNSIIDSVESYEADDFEGTTREERYWMNAAKELAVALLETTGYVRS